MNVCVVEAIIKGENRIKEDNIDKRVLYLKIEVEKNENKLTNEMEKQYILIKGICRESLVEKLNIRNGVKVIVEGEIRVNSKIVGYYKQRTWIIEIRKIVPIGQE